MTSFKKTLIQSAKLAGQFQLKHFGKLKKKDVRYKQYGEYVTYVDKFCGKLIINNLKKYFPKHNFVSEDFPIKQIHSDYTWYIDPLDGTTNYSIQNPLFGVSIGVAYKKETMEGVFFFPVLKQLFYVKKGAGAYLNNKKIHVSPKKLFHKSILTIGFPHRLPAMRRALDIFKKIRPSVDNVRIFGSAAYSFCAVASGHTEAFILVGLLKPWDVNSGILLVEEAGGAVTNFKGNKNYDGEDLVVSNGKIHQQILKKLK